MPKTITSPCIGICSSGIGDDVCRGCKRFAHEVIEWNAYTREQRTVVRERLDNFLIQIVKLKIHSIDFNKLSRKMKEVHFTLDEHLDAHLHVYQLLNSRYRENIVPRAWGFSVRPAFRGLTMAALHESIEQELYNLSQAHYERYVKPGIVRGRHLR